MMIKMIKQLSVLLIAVTALAGCATKDKDANHSTALPSKVTVYKAIVAPWQAPPDIPRPKLESATLTTKSSYATVAKALTITVKQLMDYSAKLETALSVYKKQVAK